MKVYLAGAGGLGVEYAEGWREKASDFFYINNIECINPFRHNKLRTAYNTGSYQGEKHFTPNEIMIRDLNDIRKCDLVLAEMRNDNYNYVGTSSELFFAHSLGKPVVLWTTDKYAKHPWLVAECVKIMTCDKVEDVCDYISDQWGD